MSPYLVVSVLSSVIMFRIVFFLWNHLISLNSTAYVNPLLSAISICYAALQVQPTGHENYRSGIVFARYSTIILCTIVSSSPCACAWCAVPEKGTLTSCNKVSLLLRLLAIRSLSCRYWCLSLFYGPEHVRVLLLSSLMIILAFLIEQFLTHVM